MLGKYDKCKEKRQRTFLMDKELKGHCKDLDIRRLGGRRDDLLEVQRGAP